MLVSLVNRHLAYITVTKGRQTKAIHTTTTTHTHTHKYWKIMNIGIITQSEHSQFGTKIF